MAKHILVLSNTPEVIQRVCDALEPEGYVVTVVTPFVPAELLAFVRRLTGSPEA